MVCVSSCNNIAHLSTFLTPVSFPSLLDLSHQHENMLLLLFTKKKNPSRLAALPSPLCLLRGVLATLIIFRGSTFIYAAACGNSLSTA